jgi:ATP-dependent RNA helicase DeaD
VVSLLNRPDVRAFKHSLDTPSNQQPPSPSARAVSTNGATNSAASFELPVRGRGAREVVVLPNPGVARGRAVSIPAPRQPAATRPSTWSCLTRRPGTAWRVDPPIGPAMSARWAALVETATRVQVDTKTRGTEIQGTEKQASRVSTTGDMPADYRFGALELSDPVRRAVWEMGYRQPSPIQVLAVPQLLAGKDCVGQAQTGTGKTAAFGIPIVERVDPTKRQVQAIILLPTRELCRQVAIELEKLGKYRDLSVLAVYGGEGMDRQLRALQSGVHVVVGTPGRVQDHIWRGTLRLDDVRIAVLDEADEMLDVGFAEDIERILRNVPTARQTALFSATIPSFIHTLVRRYLKDPEWVSTVDHSQPATARIPKEIRQNYVHVAERDKLAAVEELVKSEKGYSRVLVFRRMKISVDRLTEQMKRKGYSARALHGDLPQGERNRVLEDFRSGRIQFLVATNVAARGLDIKDVSHVLNFDLPETPEEYVHRIGRTGRAGKEGTAISFVAEWDLDAFEAIKLHVGNVLEERQLELYS